MDLILESVSRWRRSFPKQDTIQHLNPPTLYWNFTISFRRVRIQSPVNLHVSLNNLTCWEPSSLISSLFTIVTALETPHVLVEGEMFTDQSLLVNLLLGPGSITLCGGLASGSIQHMSFSLIHLIQARGWQFPILIWGSLNRHWINMFPRSLVHSWGVFGHNGSQIFKLRVKWSLLILGLLKNDPIKPFPLIYSTTWQD